MGEIDATRGMSGSSSAVLPAAKKTSPRLCMEGPVEVLVPSGSSEPPFLSSGLR